MSDSDTCDDALETVDDYLKSLAKSKPSRAQIKVRILRKETERKRLREKAKRQKERLAKLVGDLKATEANEQAVKVELADLKGRLQREEHMNIC